MQIFGSQYAMRIWVDPAKLNNYGLTTGDVVAAIRAQNVQVSVGSIGGLPAAPGTAINASIIGPTRLSTPEQFRNILLRVNPDGSQVRIGDVARVALNSESYIRDTKYNGKPAAGVAIRLAAGQNALETVKGIHETLDRLAPFFPRGFEVVYPLDTTPFVRTSIKEVVKTLFEAVVLVFLVMYLFLQNARATLIPTIAVPVVLLGTFGVLAAFGFSINTLTMFGMALSIGLLVDDAIVVVENVERVMAEEGLESARSHAQVHGPDHRRAGGHRAGAGRGVRAHGVLRRLDRRDLPPVLHHAGVGDGAVGAGGAGPHAGAVRDDSQAAAACRGTSSTRASSSGSTRWFDRGRARHASGLDAHAGAHRPLDAGVSSASSWPWACCSRAFPSSFLPNEDPGFIYGQVQTPPGASKERTWAALDKAQQYLTEQEKDTVEGVLTVNGFNFAGTGQNSGLLFIKLRDWDERNEASQSDAGACWRAPTSTSPASRTANIIAVPPPAVLELGNTAGFDMMLQNRGGLSREAFLAARNQLLGEAAQGPARSRTCVPTASKTRRSSSSTSIARRPARSGVSIADINQTLQTGWASTYVNDFIDRGRVKRVYVQGDPDSRMQPEDLNRWYVRNKQGRHGAVLGLRPRRVDLRTAETGALQWRAGLPDPGRAGAGPQLR